MWQWKTDTGRWNSYDSHSSLSIEKAYQRKERTTVLNCSFGSYTIDFNKMKQINNTTGKFLASAIVLFPFLSSKEFFLYHLVVSRFQKEDQAPP